MATPYKMKGSPMYRNFGVGKTTQEERDEMTPAERLLAVVPDEAAYNKLSKSEQEAFDKAGKKAGLPQTKQTK